MPNFVSVAPSVAELAHGKKSHTQVNYSSQSISHSLNQLIWCPRNRSFSFGITNWRCSTELHISGAFLPRLFI